MQPPASTPHPATTPRVGYFGGSFDPPHNGHLAVAEAARDRFHLDRVLLAPTARQPLKPQGPEATFADRLRMTELLCAGHPGLEASPIDGPEPAGQPNYTVDTLRRLHSQLSVAAQPKSIPATTAPAIFSIVGADAFAGIRQWRQPADLLDLADWIVVSRPGFSLAELDRLGLTPAQRARVHPLPGLAVPVSATALRARLHAGEDCHGLTPGPVLAFIRSHHLYAKR